MSHRLPIFLLVAILGAGLVLANRAAEPVSAEAEALYVATATPTPGPNREVEMEISYAAHDWWVTRYSDNEVLCTVTVDHQGIPTNDEIANACDKKVYTAWSSTKACTLSGADATVANCGGLYLLDGGGYTGRKKVKVTLDEPSVTLSMGACGAEENSNRCTQAPSLVLTGIEPLTSESIVSINGTLNDKPFSCMGATCEVPLAATGAQGAPIVFWADSSFGDSTIHYTGRVRVIPWGDFAAPDEESSSQPAWYVDVISSQWQGPSSGDTCSQIWDAFPAVGGAPAWLTTPAKVEDLESAEPYYYLAGSLIQSGTVDASSCPNNGLQSAGVANACGLDVARPAVVEWQNKFDTAILQVAQDTGVPANLIKRMFSRESQFWPGTFDTYKEAGLGQITSNGADTLFLWNTDFFHEFCPLILDESVCEKGFVNLSTAHQEMLRGALVTEVNASCEDCPTGIDLAKVNFSIEVFAESLVANCQQVARMMYNTEGKAAGTVSTYVDLWRFTLVNYNAGPGCLSEALKQSKREQTDMNWLNIATDLNADCEGAIEYVTDIEAAPAGAATVTPTPTRARPTATPTQRATATRGPSRTPTPTIGGYPYPVITATPSSGYPAQPTVTENAYP